MPDNVQVPKTVDSRLFFDFRFDRKDLLNNLKQVFGLVIIETFSFSRDRWDDLERNFYLACHKNNTNRIFNEMGKKIVNSPKRCILTLNDWFMHLKKNAHKQSRFTSFILTPIKVKTLNLDQNAKPIELNIYKRSTSEISTAVVGRILRSMIFSFWLSLKSLPAIAWRNWSMAFWSWQEAGVFSKNLWVCWKIK